MNEATRGWTIDALEWLVSQTWFVVAVAVYIVIFWAKAEVKRRRRKK